MTFRASRPVPRSLVLAVVLVGALPACAETTVDPAATTVAPADAPPTTAFAATGTTADLLDDLAAETAALSDLLVENEGQHEALARVEAIWALARVDVEAEHPELLDGFDRVIDLVRTSVERRRPADADKAHKNLLTLIAAYDS